MKLHWKKLSQKTVRLNKYRSMQTRHYRLPNGQRSTFYVVERGVVVAALVITPKKKIVIAKQFRPGPEKIMWELPGGGVNHHEKPVHAATREVLEETGYKGKPIYVGKSSNDAWSSLIRYHYIIRDAKKVSRPVTDEHEFIETVEISVAKLRQLIQRGQLTDGETAYRALEYLGW